MNQGWTEDVDPVSNQALQVVLSVLAVCCRAQGAVQLTLAEIIFQLQRLAEADAVAIGYLPVQPFGSQIIMQGSRGKDSIDGPGLRVPDPDQVCTELLPVFHGDEPPGLVTPNGAADVAGILLAVKRRRNANARVIGGGQPLQDLITLIEARTTVQQVTPLPSDDVNHGRPGTTQRRGKAVGRYLKLLDRILRNIDQRASDNIVIIVCAIHGHISSAAQLSGRGDDDGVFLGRVKIGGQCIAWDKEGKLKVIPAIQRKIVHLPGSNHTANDRCSGIDGRQAFCADRNLGLVGGDAQFDGKA